MTTKKVKEVEKVKKSAVEEATRRFNVKEVSIPDVYDTSRGFTSPGALSIVYAETGKRMVLSASLYKQIGRPKKVQIALMSEGMFIGKTLPKGTPPLTLNPEKNKENMKATLYNIDLLHFLIDKYGLDFEDRSSITFHDVEYIDEGNNPIAFVYMSEE